MSSYTMQLRTYIEQATQDQSSLSVRDRIEAGRTKLFDFDYPIFDEAYRKVFETHFIRKFYMREIGFETEGLFKFNLETWLIINMPYFNKLFESELLTFDPLKNSEMNVTHTKTMDSDSTSTADGTQTTNASNTGNTTRTDDQFSRDLESKNPDTRLAITTQDGAGVIEYATQIDETTNTNATTGTTNTTATGTTNDTQTVTANIDSVEDYIENRIGKTGDSSYSKLLEEYRNTFLRIENQIFAEMQELFMLVY